MAEQLTCPMCPKKLNSKSALTQHVRREHGGQGGLAELMTKYGDASPRPGGAWRKDRPLRAAPSGVPSIDWAIGVGGLPRGAICEIYGPPGSGKTTAAMTFSAYAQQHGGIAAYADAEHRFQASMAALVPGLDLDALHYSQPANGDEALNQARDFIGTGLFDVWTIDSVHGCVPKALLDKNIGEATMSELAKLMSVGCQVLDHIVCETNTVLIFVNHVKAVPGARYGRDWFKPGGSALDYYASVQLRIQPIALYSDVEGRKIGHTVKVKVENSKVGPPFAEGTFDLYYRHGKIRSDKHKDHNGQVVRPGIDLGSCWLSVCEQAGIVGKNNNGMWHDVESGEAYGRRSDMIEMLEGDCELRQRASMLVYPAQYVQNGNRSTARG